MRFIPLCLPRKTADVLFFKLKVRLILEVAGKGQYFG